MDCIRTPTLVDDITIERSSVDVNVRYKPTKVEFYFEEVSYPENQYTLTIRANNRTYSTNYIVGREEIPESLAEVKQDLDSGNFDVVITSDHPPTAKLEARVKE